MKAQLFSILVLASLIPTTNAYSQNDPGVETGQRIGNIVKTAINTALPGVTELASLIWPKSNPNRITKSDLDNQLVNARNELKSDAQSKVQSSIQIADELGVLNQFLDPTVQSYTNIVSMQTRVSLKDALSDAEWSQQKTDWKVAVNFLNKMKTISDNDLTLVKSIWLQLPLKKIREANLNFITRMDAAIESKDISTMKTLLKEFTVTLQDIPAIVGFEISALQADLKQLSEWSKGAASGGNDNLTPEQEHYKDYITKRYN